jgi:predicted RNA binding protein YcfA (HicA-like mRNA interferase family)
MSPRLPRVTGAETLRALRRAGWYVDHQKGSHVYLRHADRPGMRVTVAAHTGEMIAPKTLQSILEQAGLSADDLRRLL